MATHSHTHRHWERERKSQKHRVHPHEARGSTVCVCVFSAVTEQDEQSSICPRWCYSYWRRYQARFPFWASYSSWMNAGTRSLFSHPLITLCWAALSYNRFRGSDAVSQDVAERKLVSLFARSSPTLFNLARRAVFTASLCPGIAAGSHFNIILFCPSLSC